MYIVHLSYLDHSEALAHWPLRSNLLTSHSVCEKHKLYVALTWALHNGQTNMHLPNTLWILDVTIIPVCWNTSPTIGQYWPCCGWVETGRLCPPDLSANFASITIAYYALHNQRQQVCPVFRSCQDHLPWMFRSSIGHLAVTAVNTIHRLCANYMRLWSTTNRGWHYKESW